MKTLAEKVNGAVKVLQDRAAECFRDGLMTDDILRNLIAAAGLEGAGVAIDHTRDAMNSAPSSEPALTE